MNELESLIWTEKWRPQKFEDLILEDKSLIIKSLKEGKKIPSFIFYSSNAGTGKTSTAKIIINSMGCDNLVINSSDERGIDTIREKIKLFAQSLSSNPNIKRCVFLDEADGLTRQAQDSLRNLMETYSDNCFFIYSCNDIAKVIEPLRSRCVPVNFENPNKADIQARLEEICEKEEVKYESEDIEKLIDNYYPDIRSMISFLQQTNIVDKTLKIDDEGFKQFLEYMQKKDIDKIYEIVYSGNFEVRSFNKWFFKYLYENWQKFGIQKTAKISRCLADTERSWNFGANLELIFISNIVTIMEVI